MPLAPIERPRAIQPVDPPAAIADLAAPAPAKQPEPPSLPEPAKQPEPPAPIVSTPFTETTDPIAVPDPQPAKIVDVPAPANPPAESTNAAEGQLPAARTPVVELAPEFPVPTESAAPTTPRNVIPGPAEKAPRNVVPPQKRGLLPSL
jgi:hypothetical protein